MKKNSGKSTSSLLNAVTESNEKLVAEILKTGVDVEAKDFKGRTALMLAAYNSGNEIAKQLIAAGASVNAQDDLLNSPFLYAGANGNVELLNLGLAHGADFKVFNRYGGTALIPAAEKGHLEIVKILCKTPGFPIDHVNKLGWTALIEAVILSDSSQTQIDIVKTLVEAGADINIADNDGVSPLQHAKNKKLKVIVSILTEAGGKTAK